MSSSGLHRIALAPHVKSTEWGHYRIGVASPEEGPAIRQYIQDDWVKNHALATSERLFDWQHADAVNTQCNFIIGIDNERQTIDGLLGFIPLSQFDNELKPFKDMWLALWKAKEIPEAAGLGLALMRWSINEMKQDTTVTVGFNPRVLPIYKRLGFRIVDLDHYFRLNQEKSTFRIIETAGVQSSYSRQIVPSPLRATRLREFTMQDESRINSLINKDIRPVKSARYYRIRYIQHPLYEYHVYALQEGQQTVGLVVLRVIECNGSRALRLIDWQGSSAVLASIGPLVATWLQSFDAEYIDFYGYGWDATALTNAGFINKAATPQTIVPNHFEPFEKTNIHVQSALLMRDPSWTYRIVKGDSDLDRPKFTTTTS